MDRLFTIYRHVSPIGRVYVGITSQEGDMEITTEILPIFLFFFYM